MSGFRTGRCPDFGQVNGVGKRLPRTFGRQDSAIAEVADYGVYGRPRHATFRRQFLLTWVRHFAVVGEGEDDQQLPGAQVLDGCPNVRWS